MEPPACGRCRLCGDWAELASGFCLRLEGCYTGYFAAYVDRWPERLDPLDYVREWMLKRWVKS